MSLVKKKASKAILLLLPIIIIAYPLGFIAGVIYGYLESGFIGGQEKITKLSGFETNKELVNRLIRESKAK